MYRLKTAYCPHKNMRHEWSTCIYAHKPNDYRRAPDKYLYYPEDCKNNSSDTEEGCPIGFKC